MSQYRNGLMSVTSNSNTVYGTDTVWLGAVEPGDMLLISGDTNIYTVSEVRSDTELTIVGSYQASTKSGVNYAITRDFTPSRNYPIPVGGDIEAIRIFGQALKMIDADIGVGTGGGGGGAVYLNDLLDVIATNVPTGQVLTKRTDGMFGFEAVIAGSSTGINLGPAGPANGAELFAGLSGSNLTFRRLLFQNLAFSQTGTAITITAPTPGEVNTAVSVGSGQSYSVVKDKLGPVIRFFGLRQGPGIALVPEGDDLVFSATGGGASGGEANTASNIGTGSVALAAPKSGVNLPFKTLNFPTDRFAVTEASNTFTVSFKPQPLATSPDTAIATASTGQVLRKESDGLWKGYTPPAPGLANLAADPTPTLSNDLNLNGRKILGFSDTLSGMIEKPKVKTYVLILSTNKPLLLTGLVVRCETGTLDCRIDIGDYPDSNPGGIPPGTIEGVAGPGIANYTPSGSALVQTGMMITMTLTNVSGSAADFAFSLSYASA